MPTPFSVEVSTWGAFKRLHRLLARSGLIEQVPLIFTEGDSWFSTPVTMNLVDHLVFPDSSAAPIPVFGRGGLFFRAERSGDTAATIFSEENLNRLRRWLGAYEFDLILLSAGGNDLVGDFLVDTFDGVDIELSVDEALQIVVATGIFTSLRRLYSAWMDMCSEVRPDTPVLAHTYAYPVRLNAPSELTVANLGLVALLKDRVGPWIAPHLQVVLPSPADQARFVRALVDDFHDRVLRPLSESYTQFHFVDLREQIQDPKFWHDEMHPTGEGFAILAAEVGRAMKDLLAG